jgi:hypothetical protein
METFYGALKLLMENILPKIFAKLEITSLFYFRLQLSTRPIGAKFYVRIVIQKALPQDMLV